MMGNIAEKSTCNKSTGYIAYIFGIVMYIFMCQWYSSFKQMQIFFLNISDFSKHILSKFIYKKKKKLITMYKLFYFKCKISVLSVSLQTGEMAEYQPAPTERAINNAIPYRVPDVTYNLMY